MTLKLTQFCVDPQKISTKSSYPPKIFIFLKTPQNIEIQNFEPKKIARAYVCVKISEYPPPPPPGTPSYKTFWIHSCKGAKLFFVAFDKPRGFIFVCAMVNHIMYGPRRKKACLRGFANNKSSV